MKQILLFVLKLFGIILAIPFLLLGLVLALPFLVIAGVLGVWRRYRRLTNNHPLHWLRTRYGRGMDVAELAGRLDVSVDELQFLEPRYTATGVPKKRGGVRRLLVPDATLRKLQRRILRRLLGRLRCHPAASGFRPGKSIVHNALPHVGQAVVLKMDLVDFFPNITAGRVEAYFRRIGWNREAAELLTKLCCWEGGLPQGAPTSPMLSNLINFDFDARLAGFVKKRRGRYTRYADDITISFPRDYPRRVRGMIQFVCRLARRYGYRVHTRHKLRTLRRHQQQRVTGLVVNEKVQLPRRLRRWLRAVEHRLRSGRQATLTPEQLHGWRTLEAMIARQRRQER